VVLVRFRVLNLHFVQYFHVKVYGSWWWTPIQCFKVKLAKETGN